MLKQRIITAIVLLALLLPALFWRTPQPFIALLLVLIAAAGWEWGRLNGLGHAGSLAAGGITLALCLAAWLVGLPAQPLAVLWPLAAAAWVLGGAWLVQRRAKHVSAVTRGILVKNGTVAREPQFDRLRITVFDPDLFADDAYRFPLSVPLHLVAIRRVQLLDINILLVGADDG